MAEGRQQKGIQQQQAAKRWGGGTYICYLKARVGAHSFFLLPRWVLKIKDRNADEFFQNSEASIKEVANMMSDVEATYVEIIGELHFKELIRSHR
jgi:hypothetical protein